MKRTSLISISLLLITMTIYSQEIKGVLDISNAKPNMYLYGQFSSNIFQHFYDMDTITIPKYEIPNEVNLSDIENEFKKIIKLDFLENKCFFNSKANLNHEKGKVWIEKTAYTYNLKTKKIKYLYQLLIEFEGLKPGTESASYVIKNITYKTGLQIKKRDNYIKSLKYDFSIFEEIPPPRMELNK